MRPDCDKAPLASSPVQVGAPLLWASLWTVLTKQHNTYTNTMIVALTPKSLEDII